MLIVVGFRNGSVESIKKIIGYINDAKLDPNVGVYNLFLLHGFRGGSFCTIWVSVNAERGPCFINVHVQAQDAC